ncbi:MAG: hypothetical protein IJZ55_10205 [Lachnospiraceae bacterium]|nr:hypothetical protein [Lachnospiraceae bacterium]
MEQRRSFGEYFLFLVREGMFRLRRELWGWRGLAALVTAVYMVIDLLGAMESDRITMGQGMAVVWLVVLFPPRMGKLLYLLPFSKKERVHYLMMYLFTYLVFQIFVFFLVGAGACLISGYSYLEWLRFFFCCTLQFLIMYSGIMVYAVAVQKEQKDAYTWVTPFYRNVDWQQDDTVGGIHEDCKREQEPEKRKKKRTELTEEEWETRKKELWFNGVTVIGVIVAAFQVYIGPVFFGKGWFGTWGFWGGTVLAYVCAVLVVYVYWNRAWEEIHKKGNSGKEERVCNS